MLRVDKQADPSSPAGAKSRVSPHLAALILLSGSVRSTGLMGAIERSPLALPVDKDRKLQDLWREAAMDLARAMDMPQPLVRILADQDTPAPTLPDDPQVTMRLERDLSEFRGTGGVLRDATTDYADEDFILVANAAQVLTEPLGALAQEMVATGGDVVLISHDDGVPSGLMLVRRACLKLVPELGFMDMKEQAMPLIARQHRVTVVHRRRPTGLPIRTDGQYIAALHWMHSGARTEDAFAEDWFPTFGVIEDSASVDPSARIHDSVVLAGGRVGRGATVVRCVVCPGGAVERNRLAIDALVTPQRRR
jgi:hypothetical protein